MRSTNAVARWLLACVVMVFAMLVIGGITRLTGSGLSIVEWRPVTGALPPLDLRDWEELFAQYRRSPQFRIENAQMTLEGFRRIFWWEYIHRLVGRLTGFVFFVPLVVFWRRGMLPRALTGRMIAIALLGGAQGVMGWLMVKSGLVNDPRVSPARLALHLGFAFALAGLLLRTALWLRAGMPARAERTPRALAADALAGLVFLMALSGALVAGNHAGLAFNTWPLMLGSLVPPGLYALDGFVTSSLRDVMSVQFNHRMIALALLAIVPAFWRYARAGARRWCDAVLAVFAAQIALGIATLVLAVPISLAVLHQANALALFLTVLGAGSALNQRAPEA